MNRLALKGFALAAVASGVGLAAMAAQPDVDGAEPAAVAVPPDASHAASVVAAPTGRGAPDSTPMPETALTASGHPAPVAEPDGYWTGPTNSPVPATLSGATVITSAHRLDTLLHHRHPTLIDVSSAPRRPDNLAPGAPWLPLPHHAIPGSLWIPGPGAGEIPAPVEDFFRQQLAKATANDPTRPVVIYCHRSCWLSWNAAKRAIGYGYQHVYWYRDGIEGWKTAGLATAVIEPLVAPGS